MAEFFYSDYAAVDLDSVVGWVVSNDEVRLFLNSGQVLNWNGPNYEVLLQRLTTKYPRVNKRDLSEMDSEELEALRAKHERGEELTDPA